MHWSPELLSYEYLFVFLSFICVIMPHVHDREIEYISSCVVEKIIKDKKWPDCVAESMDIGIWGLKEPFRSILSSTMLVSLFGNVYTALLMGNIERH